MTVQYKEFKLADIANLYYGNKLDKNKMQRYKPHINFVSRTSKNNGVSDVVDEIKALDPYPAGCISLAFGGSIGSCFLQDEPFYTGQNVGVIKLPKNVPYESKLYFVTSLEKKCKSMFVTFSDEINKHFKTDLSVKLPYKNIIIPDWTVLDSIVKTYNGGYDMSNIDTSTWKKFKLSELFTIKTCKSVDRKNLKFELDGTYDFIGRSSDNYGIQGHVNYLGYEPNQKNTFSLIQIGESKCFLEKKSGMHLKIFLFSNQPIKK